MLFYPAYNFAYLNPGLYAKSYEKNKEELLKTKVEEIMHTWVRKAKKEALYKLEDLKEYESSNLLYAFQKSMEQEKIPLGIFYQTQKPAYHEGLNQINDKPLVFQEISNININKLINSYY